MPHMKLIVQCEVGYFHKVWVVLEYHHANLVGFSNYIYIFSLSFFLMQQIVKSKILLSWAFVEKRALWVCLEFAFCATLEISLFSWWNFLLNAIVDVGLRLNNINLYVPYVTVHSTFFILFHINALLLTILTTNGIKTPLPQHKQYSYKEIININFAFTSITARV